MSLKPGLVWSAFSVCLAIALVALAWSSATVLRLERAELVARDQAALEENARLALWRMDSALTLLLAQESARPYFQYSAFYRAGAAYEQMLGDATVDDALVPSPLLREATPRVLLHFQIAPGGQVTSPQAPADRWRALSLRKGQVTRAALEERSARLAILREKASPMVEVLRQQAPPRRVAALPPPTLSPPPSRAAENSTQNARSAKEYSIRAAQQNAILSNRAFIQPAAPTPPPLVVHGRVEEGTLAPVWWDDALLLTREVRVNGSTYLQGCWLDWAGIQRELLASIRDLLPNAQLEPAAAPSTHAAHPIQPGVPEAERRLAALPVRLLPGALTPSVDSAVSPVRLSLAGAWAGLLLAALSVAGLLHGVMALSERRRVFVSAVTHELRTPLTSFRLYTDMLVDGMVASEDKRRQYLERLQGEALRLGHLVENVLFYARLDGGRTAAVREALELGTFLEVTVAQLAEGAASVGLTLTLDRAEHALTVRVDLSALEQILVNLVDNACKYAASSMPPTVHVELRRDGGRALVRVRDHGPGLSASDRRRLFRPFSKSDREAAASAPGVGLGLALSRRLARAQGGDLRLDETEGGGAAFLLSLPLEEAT